VIYVYMCVCVCLRMATKQGDGVERRKHVTTTSAQRKEKSQKTSKTYSKVNDVITNTTTEKKSTVFCSLSIVFLGRPQFSMSNIRIELYYRCSTRDLRYGVLYTWELFMSAVRIVKVGAMFDVYRSFLYLSEILPVHSITS